MRVRSMLRVVLALSVLLATPNVLWGAPTDDELYQIKQLERQKEVLENQIEHQKDALNDRTREAIRRLETAAVGKKERIDERFVRRREVLQQNAERKIERLQAKLHEERAQIDSRIQREKEALKMEKLEEKQAQD